MKSVKIVSVLLLFVFLLLCASSCSKNDFEYVSSITITTAGETKEFESYYIDSFRSSKSTEKNFKAVKKDQRIYAYPEPSPLTLKKYLPPKDQMKEGVTEYTHCGMREESVKQLQYLDKYINYPVGFAPPYKYFEVTFSGDVECYYVQVKIVDNDTLVIKDKNGETTYTVTSYNITYLE